MTRVSLPLGVCTGCHGRSPDANCDNVLTWRCHRRLAALAKESRRAGFFSPSSDARGGLLRRCQGASNPAAYAARLISPSFR
jgi:hypothetical protein